MTTAISHKHAGHFTGTPFDHVVLAHDERHLRRKLLTLSQGEEVLVDLPGAVSLNQGDVLVLDDGRLVSIVAAQENLYEIRGYNSIHLSKLCWHIGNRHLPAQIEEERILIQRDHVILEMLAGLGASIEDVVAPFSPERGAYHRHTDTSHSHD